MKVALDRLRVRQNAILVSLSKSLGNLLNLDIVIILIIIKRRRSRSKREGGREEEEEEEEEEQHQQPIYT